MNTKQFFKAAGMVCLLGVGYGGSAMAVVEQQGIASLYEEALIKFQQKELATAVIHLKNALRDDPEFLAAHLLLGRAYLQQGEGALAERELDTALRLGADRALVSIPLGQAYRQQRKYRQILDEIHEGEFSPDLNAEIMTIRGGAYLELGEIDPAEQAFRKAATFNPAATSPLLGLVNVLLRKGDFNAIDGILRQAMDLGPQDSGVWHTKGSVAHARHQFDAAINAYRKALELNPDNYKVQVSMAGTYMDMGKYGLALEVLDKIGKEQAFDPQVAYLRGVAHSRLGDASASREAMLEADGIMAKLPTDVKQAHLETLLLSSLIDYSLNKMDEAYAGLELYVRRAPGNPGARKLMGSILFDRGQYDRVIGVLKPALDEIPNDYRLLTMLGTAYMKQGRYLRAIELLDRAVKQGGDAVEARTQIALGYLAQGQSEAGVEQLSEVFAATEEARLAGVTLVLEHLRRNENAQAVKIAKLLSERNPQDLTLVNLLASAEIAAGEIPAATAHLEQILKQDEKFLGAELNLVKIDLAAGRMKQARNRIEKARANHPGNTLVMLEEARLEEAAGRPEVAVELILKAVALDEQSVTNNLYLGELYIKLGMVNELNQHIQTLERLFPDDIQVMRLIGLGHLAQNNHDMARTQFRRMSNAAGYNAPVLLDAAGLLRAAGDLEGAAWALMKVLEDNPRSVPAQVALAEVQLASGKPEPAEKIISQLMRFHPNEPDGYRLQAELAMLRGEFAMAIAGYKKAMEMEGTQDAVLRLYQAYLFAGDVQTGVKLLEGKIEAIPGERDRRPLKKALAEGYLRLGDLRAAEVVYEALINADSKDPEVFNNLSMIRFRQGQDGALALARTAQELAPENPAINDTLGWILVTTGKPAEGLRYLRNASLREASNKGIRFHIAAALVALGRKDEARQELQELVGSGDEFADLVQAKSLLEQLSTGN
ncbi:XrtA/PEP-CTERM system TPR-repeat protein PrsT [Sedimenticola selenatireducens]|uniref:XrtA/PEP-CTERM system TPR-repeat protein PrsT n=1 Tax=Sedimenticola selenatireducens TaxID=191960 RepID=UPI003F4AD7B4